MSSGQPQRPSLFAEPKEFARAFYIAPIQTPFIDTDGQRVELEALQHMDPVDFMQLASPHGVWVLEAPGLDSSALAVAQLRLLPLEVLEQLARAFDDDAGTFGNIGGSPRELAAYLECSGTTLARLLTPEGVAEARSEQYLEPDQAFDVERVRALVAGALVSYARRDAAEKQDTHGLWGHPLSPAIRECWRWTPPGSSETTFLVVRFRSVRFRPLADGDSPQQLIPPRDEDHPVAAYLRRQW